MLQNLEQEDYCFLGGKIFSMKMLTIIEVLGGNSGRDKKDENKWLMGRI